MITGPTENFWRSQAKSEDQGWVKVVLGNLNMNALLAYRVHQV
jgi:hypothetical protein